MAYQEEEQTRLRRQFTRQAIALAMRGRWREAVASNRSLLENFPNDVDAYNRLARAYIELGEYPQAKEAYQRAIEIDPYNAIARKNLKRLARLGEGVSGNEGGLERVEPQQFIEEAGKAGVVKLCRLSPPEILAKAVAGSGVNLKIEGSSLMLETSHGEYLGQVEPKHGQRLIKLMEGGNKYSATIISATEEAVTAMIREVYQDPSQEGCPSFPPKGTEGFRPYVDDRMIRRELEYAGALSGEPSYTIIGAEETELLAEELADTGDENDDEE